MEGNDGPLSKMQEWARNSNYGMRLIHFKSMKKLHLYNYVIITIYPSGTRYIPWAYGPWAATGALGAASNSLSIGLECHSLPCRPAGRFPVTHLVEVLALFLQRRGLLLPLVDAVVVAVALPAELPDLRARGEHLDHRRRHQIFQFLRRTERGTS